MADGFFSGVAQLPARLGGFEAKTPCFYRDARAFTLVFPALAHKLARLLPDYTYSPAQVVPGIGAIHLTAFEYHDTDIGPYNEFAIGILLNDRNFASWPGYNLARQIANKVTCTYIHHLPVTTEIAMRAGIDVYNYPKILASIDFSDEADFVSCDLVADGERICRIRGRKLSAPRTDVLRYFCHLSQNKQAQSAEFKIHAQEYVMSVRPGHAQIEVGRGHPIAVELSELLLSTRPLAYYYMPRMQAILYGPEHLTLASLGSFVADGLGATADPASPDAMPRAAR